MIDTSGFTEFECIANLKSKIDPQSIQKINSLLLFKNYSFAQGLGGISIDSDDDFNWVFPKWQSRDELLESISDVTEMNDITYCYLNSELLPKLSLSFSFKYQMFSASINEGYYIDRENKRIIRENFDEIVHLFESIVALLSVKSWLIFPNTASFDELRDYDFIEYTGECYPESDLIETIRWYDENMFGKKN